MTAKQKLLERAHRWSEAQAERALEAAEQIPGDQGSTAASHSELLERAAALRDRQPRQVDAVELVREARADLDRRTS
ncbi:MAG: hypothetical protein R2725_11865 [Solirubrobacterales bacterium]